MALSNQHVAAVIADIKSSGQEATMAQIRAAYIADRLATAQAELSGAIAFTVSDWPVLQSFLAVGVSSTAVYPLKAAIDAKIAANDATGLGTMLLAFFAAGRAHLG